MFERYGYFITRVFNQKSQTLFYSLIVQCTSISHSLMSVRTELDLMKGLNKYY